MKRNEYLELLRVQAKWFDHLMRGDYFQAKDDKQFREGMRSLGLDPDRDSDKVFSTGKGAYFKKEHEARIIKILDVFTDMINKAISLDETGEGYIYDMFRYELENNQYILTHDYTDTLRVCGLTMETVQNHPPLRHGLEKATQDYLNDMIKWDY